jgi:DtxR family manganese transport transcriptional regulator
MKKSKKQSLNPFQETREHHFLETAEDYTEMIADLIEQEGEARKCVIAKKMGVSHVTVLRTIQRLQRDGFVETSPRQAIQLTEKGWHMAKYAKERHQILIRFLSQIGVPESISRIDAEGIEHHVSQETIDALKKFLADHQ